MFRQMDCRSRASFLTSDVLLSLLRPALLRASRFAGRRRLLPEPGACSSGCSVPLFHVENIRSPKFLGEPSVNMPRSSTPALSDALGSSASHCCLPHEGDGVGFRAMSFISGLIHAACSLAVYTSRNGSPRSRATLASSRAPPFAGQDLDLSALAERFPTPTLISSSFPFPKFLLLLGVPPPESVIPKKTSPWRGDRFSPTSSAQD